VKRKLVVLTTLVTSSIAFSAMGQSLEMLDKKINILTEEIQSLKETKHSSNGSTHIGGYGEILFHHKNRTNESGAKNTGNLVEGHGKRFVLYIGKKFNDQFKLTSELEIEDTDAIFVEQATIDYSPNSASLYSAGIMLTPVGITNLYHEPTTFYGVDRNTVENKIIPATWRSIGLSYTHQLPSMSYQVALVNSLDASKFSSSGVRSGRYKAKNVNFDKAAVVGRVDFKLSNSVLGASAYIGNGSNVNTKVSHNIYDLHYIGKMMGFKLKAMYTLSTISNAKKLNTELASVNTALVAEQMSGYYMEAGYNLLRGSEMSLEPFVRYERSNTQDKIQAGGVKDKAQDITNIVSGINFYPVANVVVKADYTINKNEAKTGSNSFNMGLGWNF